MCDLGLNYIKIDACLKDGALFWKEYNNYDVCLNLNRNMPRWKTGKDGVVGPLHGTRLPFRSTLAPVSPHTCPNAQVPLYHCTILPIHMRFVSYKEEETERVMSKRDSSGLTAA